GPPDTEAITRLREIYLRRRNWRGLLDLHRRELDALPPRTQHKQLAEMAKVAVEKLDSPKEAIHYWNRVLEIDENDLDALNALDARERRWPALVAVLARKLDLARDPAARVASLQKLASLHGEHLKNEDRALALWREVLDLEPQNTKARRVVKDIMVVRRDWDEL